MRLFTVYIRRVWRDRGWWWLARTIIDEQKSGCGKFKLLSLPFTFFLRFFLSSLWQSIYSFAINFDFDNWYENGSKRLERVPQEEKSIASSFLLALPHKFFTDNIHTRSIPFNYYAYHFTFYLTTFPYKHWKGQLKISTIFYYFIRSDETRLFCSEDLAAAIIILFWVSVVAFIALHIMICFEGLILCFGSFVASKRDIKVFLAPNNAFFLTIEPCGLRLY